MKAKYIFYRIIDLFAGAAGVILIFVTCVVCAEVVMRYFLHSHIAWSVVISESSLLYITFLTAAWILRKEGHVRVEILVSRLGLKTQAVLDIFGILIGAIVCLVFVIYGTQVTWEHYLSGVDTRGLVPIPLAAIEIIIPISSLVLLGQFLRRGYIHIRHLRELSQPR